MEIRQNGDSVTAALEAVLRGLFGTAGWSETVKFAGRYGYQLGEDDPGGDGNGQGLRSELPIFVITDQALKSDSAAGAVNGVTASQFASSIEGVLTKWRKDNDPNPARGAYLFELTLFASQLQETTQPVLDLRNLLYDLS